MKVSRHPGQRKDRVRRPGGDFRCGRFRLRVGTDPLEDLPVALACGQLLLQGCGVDAGKFEEPLVERAGILVFAVFAGNRGAAFVEHAGKDHVTAEAGARAARRLFCQIRCVHCHNNESS